MIQLFFGQTFFKPIIKTAAFDVELDGHLAPRRFCATVDLNGFDTWIFTCKKKTVNKFLEHGPGVSTTAHNFFFNMEVPPTEASLVERSQVSQVAVMS